MASYRRPRFPDVVFRDAAGVVIEYGRRWRGASPPQESYRASTHPERFAPLHTVAEALIQYLLARYEATLRDDLAVSADLMTRPDDVIRAVRITPASAEAAPLTLALTGFPGVVIHAGLLHDFGFPACGCDACDEAPEVVAEELEATVIAVTEGRYQESLAGGVVGRRPPGRRSTRRAQLDPASPPTRDAGQEAGTGVGYRFVADDGSHWRGGWSAIGSDVPADRIARAAVTLQGAPGGWQPWPLRVK